MFIERMQAQELIEKTREYLDYLEEHIENVRLAFTELSEACKNEPWVYDDYSWHSVMSDVIRHDLSKFSVSEFVQYRKHFYPVNETEAENSGMDGAWENHKAENHHHHETAETWVDIVHMVIDWTAMGYKFGDTAQQYYEANAHEIVLSDENRAFMLRLFACLEKHRHARTKRSK